MKRSLIVASIGIVAVGTAAALSTFRGLGDIENESAAVSTLSITVDVSDRQLYVIRNGETLRSYPVAVGKSSHPTPRGSFRMRRIIWNPRWVPPDAAWARDKKARAPGDPQNPMGKVKLFFSEPDYYIHGTRDVDSLGRAESHGCIRMRNSDVVSLARLAMEDGGSPRSAGWFRRVINRVRSSEEVRLSNPIAVRIRS